MPYTLHIERKSRLAAPAATVWARATTLDGVNAELWPIRMSAPAEWRTRPIHEFPCGRPLFDSWILLFGLLPNDIHHFQFESVGPGMQFQEHSSSMMNRQWRHRRVVEADGEGCIVTDTLEIVPRIALFGRLMAPVYRLVFWNRHRKLRRWYGTRDK